MLTVLFPLAGSSAFGAIIHLKQNVMNQDQLYLLKHDFVENGKTYYCPGCVEVLGLLEIYPKLKQTIVIHYVDFTRPRPELVSLLGEENQSCPVLVIAEEPPNLPEHLVVQHSNGRAFVDGSREIGEYFAHVHGIGVPH
jgi:hypothetical protein